MSNNLCHTLKTVRKIFASSLVMRSAYPGSIRFGTAIFGILFIEALINHLTHSLRVPRNVTWDPEKLSKRC